MSRDEKVLRNRVACEQDDLMDAARVGNLVTVLQCLEAGVDVNCTDAEVMSVLAQQLSTMPCSGPGFGTSA
jgi:hypothetical protein